MRGGEESWVAMNCLFTVDFVNGQWTRLETLTVYLKKYI